MSYISVIYSINYSLLLFRFAAMGLDIGYICAVALYQPLSTVRAKSRWGSHGRGRVPLESICLRGRRALNYKSREDRDCFAATTAYSFSVFMIQMSPHLPSYSVRYVPFGLRNQAY